MRLFYLYCSLYFSIMSVHISANPGEIAPIVLMPGDPLRAKYVAENWLSELQLVSQTRNIFFYTGQYKGHRISVGASGMGCPSIGIYSYELYKEYNVDTIIRIGTAGSYHANVPLYQLINVEHAASESTFAKAAFEYEEDVLSYQGNAFDTIKQTAEGFDLSLLNGTIHSSDVFYSKHHGTPTFAQKHGALAVEMESFALFANARFLGKNAAALLTISDVIPTGEVISADARERSLKPMIELALESAILL
jgi:purine-nucleoside phosphorylase